MTRTTSRLASQIVAIATLFLSVAAHAREKSDVVLLINGDRLTGEILELRYGQLSLKTDSLGTVSIDWLDIARIESRHSFFIEMNAGERYSGIIAAAPEPGHLLVSTDGGSVDLPVANVAMVSQLEGGFIERLTGSVSLGFNETRSSDVSSLTFGFDTEYRSDKVLSRLDGNYSATKTTESGTLSQYSLNFASQFLLPGDHFWLGMATYESNEQQGIDGRLLVGGARGKYWVRKADAEFATFAGIALTQEWATVSADDQQSVEGLFGLQWKVFRFRDPKTTLTSRLAIMPSLTETGRYRGNTLISLDHEIVKDFYIDLSFSGTYDSDPPEDTAESVDYSVSTSLRYKF